MKYSIIILLSLFFSKYLQDRYFVSQGLRFSNEKCYVLTSYISRVYLIKDGLAVKRSNLLANDPSIVPSTHMNICNSGSRHPSILLWLGYYCMHMVQIHMCCPNIFSRKINESFKYTQINNHCSIIIKCY